MSEVKVLVRLVSSGSSEGACPTPLLYLPVGTVSCWQSSARGSVLLISASLRTWPSPLASLCPSVPFPLRTLGSVSGPTHIQCDLILITSARTLFPKKVTVTSPGAWMWNKYFYGAQFNP